MAARRRKSPAEPLSAPERSLYNRTRARWAGAFAKLDQLAARVASETEQARLYDARAESAQPPHGFRETADLCRQSAANAQSRWNALARAVADGKPAREMDRNYSNPTTDMGRTLSTNALEVALVQLRDAEGPPRLESLEPEARDTLVDALGMFIVGADIHASPPDPRMELASTRAREVIEWALGTDGSIHADGPRKAAVKATAWLWDCSERAVWQSLERFRERFNSDGRDSLARRHDMLRQIRREREQQTPDERWCRAFAETITEHAHESANGENWHLAMQCARDLRQARGDDATASRAEWTAVLRARYGPQSRAE